MKALVTASGVVLTLITGGCQESGSTAPTPAAPAPATEPAPATPNASATSPSTATPALAGFTNTATRDVFGYYLPAQQVMVGPWQVDHLHIGPPDSFTEWTQGRRIPTYGPVMLQLEDTTSARVRNPETGAESASVVERVLPTAYRVTDDAVEFTGTSRLGPVRFAGRLNSDLVNAANETGGAPERIVLTGELTVGEARRQVSFTWFGGD